MRRRKRRAPLDLLHLLRYAQSKVLDADWHRKEGLDAACKGPLTPSMHTTPNPVADAGGQSKASRQQFRAETVADRVATDQLKEGPDVPTIEEVKG